MGSGLSTIENTATKKVKSLRNLQKSTLSSAFSQKEVRDMESKLNLLPTHLRNKNPSLLIKIEKTRASKLEKIFDKNHIMNIRARNS